MARLIFPIFIFLLVLGCSPSASSDTDYFKAVERYWPEAQAEFKNQSAFYERHAEGFREGAELRRNVAASLGRSDDGVSTDNVASQSEANAEAARWLSEAKLTSVSNIRCVPANALPGENCEMEVVVTGTDGKEHKMGGAWRFDKIDDAITIVDMIQQ